MLEYDSDQGFWHDQLGRFDVELGSAGPDNGYLFVPDQLQPEVILESIKAGDDDFEAQMLQAGQTMIDCRLSLQGVGPPPVNPAEGIANVNDSDQYHAYREACVSYEAAGKLFNRGIELRNLEIMKAAYPFVRDGDRVLCSAGFGAFSCRGRKKP